jgi:phospholipid/cholesterol/gamma-HCH transport system substrate-binding protein
MYDELVTTIAEIKNGANEAKTFIANAQKIIDQVKSGQGAIGALVFDQKAGDDIKVSIANIRSVSEKISRGEGSLGKLLSDESLFRDAQSIMKKADRALDGLDDTGPITAVGVVYGGLF